MIPTQIRQLRSSLRQTFKYSSFCTITNSDKSLFSKLAFIGGGKMAEAFLCALQTSGAQNMSNIHVNDVNDSRLTYLKEKYGVQTSLDVNETVQDSEMVILACKPQNLGEIAESIKTPVTGVLLSIIAGKRVEEIQKKFSTKLVIRTMPNTPASIMEGMTVWYTASQVPQEVVQRAKLLLEMTGTAMLVTAENTLDMATAISGTGPAYVFLTMEAMIDTAVHIGIPREMAKIMVGNTVKGSAIYALQSKESVSDLRYNVTSPGGTTASALYELERGGYRTVVADAVWAAYRRSLELGNIDSNVGPGRSK